MGQRIELGMGAAPGVSVGRVGTPFKFSLVTTARFSPATSDEAMLSAINRYALKPLEADDVAAFTFELCNDQIDSWFSRFPVEELEKIVELAKGEPLMERHDWWSTLPRGTIFDAWLERSEGMATVMCRAYLLRIEDNASFIANIEGGVYRDISIGFSFKLPECSICGTDIRGCSHQPGHEYEGKLCVFVMRQVDEVLEASVVFAGAQGTQIVEALREIQNSKCKMQKEDKTETEDREIQKAKGEIQNAEGNTGEVSQGEAAAVGGEAGTAGLDDGPGPVGRSVSVLRRRLRLKE